MRTLQDACCGGTLSPAKARNGATPMNHVEHITANGRALVYIIRAELTPAATTFVTPDEFTHQVGLIVYPSGGEVKRQMHKPLERHIVGTSEVIIVRRGRCELDVYDDDRA